MPTQSDTVYAFGPYVLDVDRRALTCEGQPVALAPKTFELLLVLVRSSGRAVSKQELMSSLWPGTFVEEANLSFQVSMLRKALGNGTGQSIETVPKHGYRFSADVVVVPAAVRTPPVRPAVPAVSADARSTAAVAAQSTPVRWRTGRWLALTCGSILVLAAVSFVFLRARPSRPPDRSPALIATPLTAYQGEEVVPSLSPDGSQVAFAWNGPRQDNYDIYVKLVGSGEPVRLTTDPARDDKPAYSPDGRRIAFLRFAATNDSADLFVVPALGGAQRRVTTIVPSYATPRFRPMSDLSWTPDGKWLAVGILSSPGEPPGIWLLEVDGTNRRRLTTAQPTSKTPNEEYGDVSPAFSADGRRMVFVRETGPGVNAIYVLPLSSDLTPAGDPVKVAGETRSGVLGVAWTPDDSGLVFASGGHLGLSRLYRVALSPDSAPIGSPEMLPVGEQATALSIARTGRLAYSTQFRDTDLWQLDLTDPAKGPEEPPLGGSTFDEETPDYSPDGTRLAFASTRSGTEEIWISNADGSSPRQMTSMGGATCANPQWSPDGQTILFNARAAGSADLYLLRWTTGEVQRLTSDPLDEAEARWSRDSRSIYFGSNRTGRIEVWNMPVGGGRPRQVTRSGGTAASESPDGRFLYYAKRAASPTSIWRMPVQGGAETLVTEGLSYSLNFVLANRGLYFMSVGAPHHEASIEFVDYTTGRTTTLAPLGKPWWFGAALSRDQRRLLYSVIDRAGSNLVFADNLK
jgi:Tol biopolymer transport system component/DNA-binding winged helix-turn-helix (wHTH) protein